MSEKKAKYSEIPGKKSEKIQNKFKKNRKKIAKIFLKKGAYKSHKCESIIKELPKKETLKCARTLT